MNRARVIARLAFAYLQCLTSGAGLKLITLTFNRDVDRAFLHTALQHLCQSLRRRYTTFEYARFPEYTRQGRYHIHLVALAPYIPQAELSKLWKTASKGAYIVDIRRVHTPDHLARYVTKYLTKAPAAKVTYSRAFPIAPLENDDQQHQPEGVEISYAWMDHATAMTLSAGAPQLWTGEPCYPNGPCTCFNHLHDHHPPQGALCRNPHPKDVVPRTRPLASLREESSP